MTQDKALEILQSGKNVFLTGEPGAGKTHTINRFVEWCREGGINVCVTASTGIASTHINGVTIHSWSGIGTKETISTEQIWNMHFSSIEKIQECEVLIVDEVSMLDARFIGLLHKVMMTLNQNESPFGGTQVVFVGDFFQLPPVVKDREMKFAFESKAWMFADPVICYLTEQHRQSDAVFLDLLGAIRSRRVTDGHREILKKRFVFNEDEQPKTKLYTKNYDVDSINNSSLEELEGEERVFRAEISGSDYGKTKLRRDCISPEILRLKIGAVVMFTRNNFEKGYVNGTLGVIESWSDGWFPYVRTKDGSLIMPNREEWVFEEAGVVKATFKQLPLKLAWAITVHKSQGMSLDEALVDLSSAFEYGQGYVAISRVRTLSGLFLKGMNDMALKIHPKVALKDAEFRRLGA